MKYKIISIILICFSLNSCGYAPMYIDNSNQNLKVLISEKSGDRDINNLIESNLKNYLNNNSNNIFKIKIFTEYQKKSLAKDTSGKTTDYQMTINVDFQISNHNKINEIKLIETFNYKSMEDKISEINYENTIKKNMTNIIVNKFVSSLSRMK